jgi:hypothetical protein
MAWLCIVPRRSIGKSHLEVRQTSVQNVSRSANWIFRPGAALVIVPKSALVTVVATFRKFALLKWSC